MAIARGGADGELTGYDTSQGAGSGIGITGGTVTADPAVAGELGRIDAEQADPSRTAAQGIAIDRAAIAEHDRGRAGQRQVRASVRRRGEGGYGKTGGRKGKRDEKMGGQEGEQAGDADRQ
ncbi:hypothetical protein OY671_010768, partial [Metschnikowia pulcherrima]